MRLLLLPAALLSLTLMACGQTSPHAASPTAAGSASLIGLLPLTDSRLIARIMARRESRSLTHTTSR